VRGGREKDRIEDEDDDDENDGPLARRLSLANSKLFDQTHLATAVPTARQLDYQDWEMGIFFHFGIRTFHEGRNIGHKAICRVPLVACRKVIVEVTDADGAFALRGVELHNTAGLVHRH